MRARRIFSLRFIAFSLTPLFLVLLAAESAARVKYFVAHDYDWHYLTTPFPLNARSLSMEQRMPLQVRMALQAPAPPTVTAAPQTSTRPVAPGVPQTSAPAAAAIVRTPPQDVSASTAHATPQRQTVVQPSPERQEVVQAPLERQDAVRASPQGQDAVLAPSRRQDAVQTRTPPAAHATEQPAPQDQMAFLWPTPCVSGMVYSTDRRTMLPRTWDANCFRGDRVTVQKNADEYRIAFLGGSTVQDFQSDEEMMTAQFRQLLPGTPAGKHPVVINAGRSGFGSRLILDDYRSRVARFSIDLVLYYEAWNEQPTDLKPSMKADRIISTVHNQLHSALYHRSLLYTYLIEKYAFLLTSRERFWKIDVNMLQRNFIQLAREVRSRGTLFTFVTQAVRFPRMWKGVDTFDYVAVDALLDRLKADSHYVYDVTEISALNQRLAVLFTLGLCKENGIPVINILEPIEALGEVGRAELFMDLGHLTVKGDRFVGELIAKHLNVSN